MCLQVEVAPGRVCAEDRAQLWAGAPQGDLCAVRCVMSVYQDITSVFFVPVLLWFLLLLVFHLFLKSLPIKQTYTETLTLDLIMELLY